MLKLTLMQHHHHPNINGTFHTKPADSGKLILVLNADNYVMAEYNVRTGETSWQRLVNAPQKEQVEMWLTQTYPVQSVAKASPVKARKR
jgi:hypothetical protein